MSNLPSRVLPRREPSVDALIGAFESETQAVILRTSPRSEHTILYVLVAMVLLGFVLMAVTKLDRVVTGSGEIEPIAGTLYVQPFQEAVIREIRVKPGDVVKKGQVLATLDPTFAAADVAQNQQKLASTAALVARLEAELDGQPYVPASGDQAGALQLSIYQQDVKQYAAGLADFDARIAQQRAQIAQLHGDANGYRKHLEITTQVEQSYLKLEQEGWGSKLRSLDATNQRVEADRLLAQTEGEIPGIQHALDALVAQRAVYVQQTRTTLSNGLADARNTLHVAQNDLTKAARLQDLSTLNAPMDAIVLKVGKASTGSVAASGGTSVDPLFTLVPLDAPVEVELHVGANNVGFIQVGQQVAVKLDAYSFLQHGTAKGVIKTISEGTFTTDDVSSLSTAPYFKVFVTLTDVALHDVPSDFRLIPGMTTTGDIMVGKRTILSYLVEGGLRTGSEAMREP